MQEVRQWLDKKAPPAQVATGDNHHLCAGGMFAPVEKPQAEGAKVRMQGANVRTQGAKVRPSISTSQYGVQ